MRKSGYASAASKMAPSVVVDVRQERPEPPVRLSGDGKALWRDLVESRRAQWFRGAEAALESYVVAVLNCRKLEAALRDAPGIDARFGKDHADASAMRAAGDHAGAWAEVVAIDVDQYQATAR
jgi:hypothetical protein